MQPLSTVLCTSGLKVEAKIAQAAGFSVVIGAGDRDRTAALVAKVAAQTECLISFGIAGGLASELRAGTVIVSGEVVSEGHHWAVESHYMQRLSNFARSIADTARRDLPPAALVPLCLDGNPDLLGVLAAVLRRPLQITGMIGLARETRMALSALVGPAQALRSFVATA